MLQVIQTMRFHRVITRFLQWGAAVSMPVSGTGIYVICWTAKSIEIHGLSATGASRVARDGSGPGRDRHITTNIAAAVAAAGLILAAMPSRSSRL